MHKKCPLSSTSTALQHHTPGLATLLYVAEIRVSLNDNLMSVLLKMVHAKQERLTQGPASIVAG